MMAKLILFISIKKNGKGLPKNLFTIQMRLKALPFKEMKFRKSCIGKRFQAMKSWRQKALQKLLITSKAQKIIYL